MSQGTELAKAYVQIIPSADGITGSISKVLGSESESAGTSAGKSIASSIKSVLVSAAIGSAIKESISAGADLQQAVGGVETLFKDSASVVIANAEKAYKTAGLSANEYMETITSFSASLLQGLGGDTEQAASIADRAIVDMSDNANKFGTDMASIQNAYQGFAKQNYTMLDNLKLGYGGTKSEMERLIQDAAGMTEEMTKLGISVDANSLSFDNIVNAISVMQEHLEVSGTTAMEADSTITGSVNSMKAAFQNLLGYLTTGNNIQPAVQDLIETTMVFAENNLVPALEQIISSIPTLIIALIDRLPEFIQTGIELIVRLVQGLIEAIPRIIEVIPDIISAIWNGVRNVDWRTLGTNIIEGIREGIASAAAALGNAARQAAENALGSVKKFLGIHSPSTVFRDQVGEMMALGMAEGIEDNTKAVTDSMRELSRSTVGTLNSIPALPSSYGGSGNDSVVNALYTIANTIVNTINNKNNRIEIGVNDIKSALDIQAMRYAT